MQTQEDLKGLFHVQQRRKQVCYAITMRTTEESGQSAVNTVIRWPCDDRWYLPEFLEILAVAAGKPPGDSVVDYSETSVCVVPAYSLDREPREVMDELLKTGVDSSSSTFGHDPMQAVITERGSCPLSAFEASPELVAERVCVGNAPSRWVPIIARYFRSTNPPLLREDRVQWGHDLIRSVAEQGHFRVHARRHRRRARLGRHQCHHRYAECGRATGDHRITPVQRDLRRRTVPNRAIKVSLTLTSGKVYQPALKLEGDVANRLLQDLVAYEGPATTCVGPLVAAPHDFTPVNDRTSDCGSVSLFSASVVDCQSLHQTFAAGPGTRSAPAGRWLCTI